VHRRNPVLAFGCGALEQGFVFYSRVSPPEFQLRAGFSFAALFARPICESGPRNVASRGPHFVQPATRDSMFDAWPRITSLFEPRVRVISERFFNPRNPYCLADMARVFQRYYFYIFSSAF
jgi:hypothetical protein